MHNVLHFKVELQSTHTSHRKYTANGILHGTDTDSAARTQAHVHTGKLCDSVEFSGKFSVAAAAAGCAVRICVCVAEHGKLYEREMPNVCLLACIRIRTAWNICMESGEPHAKVARDAANVGYCVHRMQERKSWP